MRNVLLHIRKSSKSVRVSIYHRHHRRKKNRIGEKQKNKTKNKKNSKETKKGKKERLAWVDGGAMVLETIPQ